MNKKIYALIIGLFTGLGIQAQTTYTVNYLVVAGGGGGGYSGAAGGGGAGGLLQSTISLSSSSTYSVVVGSGGAGGSTTSYVGLNGGNSSAFGLTAIGGGGGSPGQGNSGGSGGGSGRDGTGAGAAGTSGQGNDGGMGGYDGNQYPSSGGGGAGAKGEDLLSNNPGHSGSGGIGVSSSISGTATYYAGGGGGGSDYGCSRGLSAGTGGNGGGGNGGNGSNVSTIDGVAGAPNTGGGGGGAAQFTDCSTTGNGGNGGSGVVILSFTTGSITYTQSGGVVTTSGGNTIVTFINSGTFNITGGSTSSASSQPWILKTDSSSGPIYHVGKVGIGNNNPQLPLDVTGNARISGNLYVGGGLIESPQISAITSLNTDSINALSGSIKFADTVKMAKTLKVNNNIDAKSISFGGVPAFSYSVTTDSSITSAPKKVNQINLLSNMSVQGNLIVKGTAGFDSLDAGSSLGFGGGTARIAYTAPNSVSGGVIYMGGTIHPTFHFPCVLPANPGATAPWNTVIQDKLTIWTPYSASSNTPQQVLTIANDYSGASIDLAGAAANTANPTGILLMNYYCGKDVSICTNTANNGGSNGKGGVVSVGQNFQIGTPSFDVNTALNVKANGSKAFVVQGNSNSSVFQIAQDGTTLISSASTNSSPFKVGNGSISSMFEVASNGDIGINSQNLIHLNGLGDAFHFLGVFQTFQGATINGPVLQGYQGGALASTYFGGTPQIALMWGVTGNVGIGNFGTAGPQAQLDVLANSTTMTDAIKVTNSSDNLVNFKVKTTGQVYAREIIVSNNSFPDYVFAKNYNLMPLNEVKNYIDANHHLPNMPTAAEVEKNGANLGEIQRVSVEKIEELTLYMIEMKKEIEKLKQENKELKSLINK